MKKELRVLELFSGIGAPRKALMRGGYNFVIVDAIEIDKYPVASYNAIYGEHITPKDITTYFPTKEEMGEIDLIWNSSPCQDISFAGKGAGAKEGSGTRSSLIYEAIRVIEALKPKYVVWENVKGLTSKKHRPILDDYIDRLDKIGYNSQFQVLNSKDYGIPQNRERVFVVSIRNDIDNDFKFPEKQELKLKLKDMLENEVDNKYYLSDAMIDYISAVGTKGFIKSDCNINLDIARTLTTKQGYRASITNYISEDLPPNYNLNGGYVEKKYEDFIETNGYIPDMFNPYNKKEIKDIAPTQSTCCGSATSSATVLISEIEGQSGLKQPVDRDYKKHGAKREECMEFKKDNCSHALRTSVIPYTSQDLRIRKLTPKECWRLMGFDDEDFEKASKVNSDTQLYKQAGNSVVVNVIEAIFHNLLTDYQ